MNTTKPRPDFSNVDEFTAAMIEIIEKAVDEEQNRMLRILLATDDAAPAAGSVTTEVQS